MPVKECVLVKTGKQAQACTVCKVDEQSVVLCALAPVTQEEAGQLVLPPIGGPRFAKVRNRLQQPVVPDATDHMATLLELLRTP